MLAKPVSVHSTNIQNPTSNIRLPELEPLLLWSRLPVVCLQRIASQRSGWIPDKQHLRPARADSLWLDHIGPIPRGGSMLSILREAAPEQDWSQFLCGAGSP